MRDCVASCEANMKKEDARRAVLREYDRWAKDHPKDAKKMGGFVFFGYLERIPVTWKRSLHVGSNWCILAG